MSKKTKKPIREENNTHTEAQVIATFTQAMLAFSHGQISQARELCEQVLRLQPNHYQATILINKLHNKLSQNGLAAKIQQMFAEAMSLRQNGFIPQAQERLQEIIRIQPNHADALHLLGIVFGQTGNFERSIELISQAIALNPSNGEAYYNRAKSLQGINRHQLAVDDYNRAISLRPDDANAYHSRGTALQALKQELDK